MALPVEGITSKARIRQNLSGLVKPGAQRMYLVGVRANRHKLPTQFPKPPDIRRWRHCIRKRPGETGSIDLQPFALLCGKPKDCIRQVAVSPEIDRDLMPAGDVSDWIGQMRHYVKFSQLHRPEQ